MTRPIIFIFRLWPIFVQCVNGTAKSVIIWAEAGKGKAFKVILLCGIRDKVLSYKTLINFLFSGIFSFVLFYSKRNAPSFILQ
jgi:hypothetical protein